MKTKFFALVFVLALIGVSYAHHDNERIIQEASRRGMKLITEHQAMEIAIKRFEPGSVHVKEIELDDHYGRSSEFRPVYELECIANGQEYDMKIDAVTGEIVKLKRDD